VKHWLGSRWFAPSDLQRLARTEAIEGAAPGFHRLPFSAPGSNDTVLYFHGVDTTRQFYLSR